MTTNTTGPVVPDAVDMDGHQITLGWGKTKRTKPGDWKNKKLSLAELVTACTTHRVGEKDGSCFLQGSTTGGMRTAQAMDTLPILALDVDNGIPSSKLGELVKASGYFCIRYTTYSHGKRGTTIKDAHWTTWKKKNPDGDIAAYLIEVKGYLPEIARTATLGERKMAEDGSGAVYSVDHDPTDKNRLVFVLETPWRSLDPRYTVQRDAIAAWKVAILNLARELGVVVDESCTDTSRLLYLPSHPVDPPKPPDHEVYPGKAVDIFTLPQVPAKAGVAAATNVYVAVGAAMGASEGKPGDHLKGWAAKYAKRFQIHDAIAEHAPDKLRPEADHDDLHHIECPFEHEHTNAGGSATYVVDAGKGTTGVSFVVKCMHASCAERTNLEFLAEMIDAEWMPDAVRTDGAFLIDVEEDEAEDAPKVVIPAIGGVTDLETGRAYLEAVAKSGADALAREAAVEAVRKELAKHGVAASKVALRGVLNDSLRAGKATAKEREVLARQEEAAKRRENRVSPDGRPIIYAEDDHDDQMSVVRAALTEANDAKPRLFNGADGFVKVRRNALTRLPSIVKLGLEEFRAAINDAVRCMDDGRQVAPFDPLTKQTFVSDNIKLHALERIVTAPVFGEDGKINITPGYSEASRTFFEPAGGLVVPHVAETPTDADIAKARDLLLDNVLVDFPFDGPGDGASERAHALAMILLPFARRLIDGATPVHLIVKPTPGTGAGLLVDAYSLIAHGERATAQTETKSEEEMRKRLISVLLDGSQTFYLDNINYRIDSSSLASTITSGRFKDRLLGSNKTIDAPAWHTWIFAGNNVQMSGEITRRCVRIRVDAKVERPENRTDFKHKNLIGWVRQNRGELIWACLTLIQHWIAKGKPEGEKVMGSFEHWSRVMGGILECAAVDGFLGNEGELRADADSDGDSIKPFLAAWWARYGAASTTANDMVSDAGLEEADVRPVIPEARGRWDECAMPLGKLIRGLKDRIYTIDAEEGPVKVRIEKNEDKKTGNKAWWMLVKKN